ncbi:MAG: hypothetical protein IT321_15990 [Anaerolineae bacterium]|nr:hypothetical protein [Anaerolineae bacterium]
MRIKLNPRVIFEASVIVLLFLTLYIEWDLGFAGIISIFCVKPFLIFLVIIMLVIRIWQIFPLSRVTPSKLIAPILIGGLLAVSIMYANEIIFAREIIRFHFQREWFDYVVSAATQPTCDRVREVGCVQWFTFPDGTPPLSATVYRFEDGLAIDVDSRIYIGYLHLTNQTGLPQAKSIGMWKFGCEYALGDGWYLCGGGT